MCIKLNEHCLHTCVASCNFACMSDLNYRYCVRHYCTRSGSHPCNDVLLLDAHSWLLGSDVDILPFLLLPLAGPEELSEEEMEGLPEDLQYLRDDKKREDDPDIRKMLIESVMQV